MSRALVAKPWEPMRDIAASVTDVTVKSYRRRLFYFDEGGFADKYGHQQLEVKLNPKAFWNNSYVQLHDDNWYYEFQTPLTPIFQGYAESNPIYGKKVFRTLAEGQVAADQYLITLGYKLLSSGHLGLL